MSTTYTGEQIASARKARGLTQKQLAERLNVTDKAVSKWERGLNYPDIALLSPLAEILAIPLPQLLCEKGATAEQATQATYEVALAQWREAKRTLRAQWVEALIAALLIIASQFTLSYILHQRGVYGWPQGLSMGLVSIPGSIVGISIRSLRKLKKL